MFRIEVEKVDGDCFFYGQAHLTEDGRWFENVTDADVTAEKLWHMKSGSGVYARFSVVDGVGNRVTDWECD